MLMEENKEIKFLHGCAGEPDRVMLASVSPLFLAFKLLLRLQEGDDSQASVSPDSLRLLRSATVAACHNLSVPSQTKKRHQVFRGGMGYSFNAWTLALTGHPWP